MTFGHGSTPAVDGKKSLKSKIAATRWPARLPDGLLRFMITRYGYVLMKGDRKT